MDKYRHEEQLQTIPTLWVNGVNNQFDALRAENRQLRAQLKALTDHLEVEFKDRPAIPAYVAVVPKHG